MSDAEESLRNGSLTKGPGNFLYPNVELLARFLCICNKLPAVDSDDGSQNWWMFNEAATNMLNGLQAPRAEELPTVGSFAPQKTIGEHVLERINELSHYKWFVSGMFASKTGDFVQKRDLEQLLLRYMNPQPPEQGEGK